MQFTAAQIAQLLNGTLEGNADITVTRLSKIEEGGAGSLSFLANPAYTPYIYSTTASLVIVNKDFVPTAPIAATLLRVDSAEKAFAKLLGFYNTLKLDKKGISPQAVISAGATHGTDCYIGALAFIGENARIGNNVKIYPQAYIGDNVTVGDNTTVFAGVKIYGDCVVGARCIIHSGTVIGSDGFRFATGPDGGEKIPQIGNVVIEDDVEIGANCAIDRATLGSTILRKGVKFDNLVHIAHNVVVGENTYIAAAKVVGLAGGTRGKVLKCLKGPFSSTFASYVRNAPDAARKIPDFIDALVTLDRPMASKLLPAWLRARGDEEGAIAAELIDGLILMNGPSRKFPSSGALKKLEQRATACAASELAQLAGKLLNKASYYEQREEEYQHRSGSPMSPFFDDDDDDEDDGGLDVFSGSPSGGGMMSPADRMTMIMAIIAASASEREAFRKQMGLPKAEWGLCQL